jgi:hypothetical protein
MDPGRSITRTQEAFDMALLWGIEGVHRSKTPDLWGIDDQEEVRGLVAEAVLRSRRISRIAWLWPAPQNLIQQL